MSITSVNSYASPWQWPSLQDPSTSGSGTTTITPDNITNTGTVSSNPNLAVFMQAFSADLQSMLTQAGEGTNTVTNSGTTTASATSSTDPTQKSGALHHHHHHHGEGDSMDEAANAGVVQSDTLTSSQINQSASLLASDVMQAFETYGTARPNGGSPPQLSTVA